MDQFVLDNLLHADMFTSMVILLNATDEILRHTGETTLRGEYREGNHVSYGDKRCTTN